MGLSSERGTGSLSGNPTSHRLEYRDYGCSLFKTKYIICIIDVSKHFSRFIKNNRILFTGFCIHFMFNNILKTFLIQFFSKEMHVSKRYVESKLVQLN